VLDPSLKAFVKSGQGQLSEAGDLLDEEMKIAPYSAAPYVESGFIFNRIKKPDLGLQSYLRAYKLSTEHKNSKVFEAPALRGMAFSLIDLGDLDKAEAVLTESLKVDPGNEVAQIELEYIRRLRASKR
jgi:tetratricopeptide (TPR) repeat protein